MENKKLIMLVDDDRTSNFLNKKILKNLYPQYEIIDFLGAEEALLYLDTTKGQKIIDVILLDINMPELDGWDFLSEIKAKGYTNFKTIIMLSSSIDESDMEKAKTYSEVSGFITKPLNTEMFARFMT